MSERQVTAAVAGAVSAGMALGAAELVTGIAGDGPSLVSAVGTEFIERFAGSLKDLAVSLFGTNLTDEYMLNSGFFHGIWGYDFSSVGRPREVGVSLNFQF